MALAQSPISLDDTIVAVASAPGAAVEGIIRLSGPAVPEVLSQIVVVRSANERPFAKRSASVSKCQFRLRSEWRDEPVLLEGSLYLWPNDRSYTRQPLAELYLPGSPPLLDLAVRNLCHHGTRLARPGEFTLRAFLAGRLDLTQAEAVLGVIEARDAGELQTALSQLAGGLAGRLNALRNQLLDLLAHLEAGLDFADEDIEFISRSDLQQQVENAAEVVSTLVQQLQSRSEASSNAPRVVLLGEPNAGKSSLLNALAGSAAALVSPIAGTTRDYLTRLIEINGQRIQLIDTAGVEESTSNEIALSAQMLGQSQHQQADLQLLCIDASQALSDWSRSQLVQQSDIPRIIVWTKCDLPNALQTFTASETVTEASATTSAGLNQLRTAIASALQQRAAESSVLATTAARASASLQAAATALAAAADLAASGGSEEWIAAELRLALDELGQVTGAVYTDDILDRVFSRFCIGK
jgi:tRNA modification GTPase